MVPMQTGPTVRAGMPADRQALLHQDAAAATSLAGRGRRHSYHSLPGACSLESEDGQEPRPARIADALGKVVVLDPMGRLPIFMGDAIVGAHQPCCVLVMEVAPLVGDGVLRFRQEHNRGGAAMAPLLTPRHPPSAAAQRRCGFAVIGRSEDAPSISAGGERLEPAVNAGLLSCSGQRMEGNVGAGDRHVPPIDCSSDRARLIVTVLGVPLMGRCSLSGMRPMRESASIRPSSVAPLPYGGEVKLGRGEAGER